MTRSNYKWRVEVYRSAGVFAEELSEFRGPGVDDDPPTLVVAFQALVRSLQDNGFSKPEIEEGLAMGRDDAAELIDRSAYRQGVDFARANKAVGRTFVGKLLRGAGNLGGFSIGLGLVVMVGNLFVAVARGPAWVVAWVSLGLIGSGILLAVASNKAADGLVRSRLRKERLASGGTIE